MRPHATLPYALSLIATVVAGCDEPRRTLAPMDAVVLDDVSMPPPDLRSDISIEVDSPAADDASTRDDAGAADAAVDAVTVLDTPDVVDARTELDAGHGSDASDAAADAPPDVVSDVSPDVPSGARATPVLDGVIGTDWPAETLVAVNTEPSPWGPTLNALRSLRVAWDDRQLYLAVEGVVESQNAIAIYLDKDFLPGSSATGVARFSDLTDAIGALDNALSAAIGAVPAGFGAELAWGTLGMLRKGATELRADIGLRDIGCSRCAGDFGWVAGDVAVCASGATPACEVAIPWSAIYGASGLPPIPRLGLFVRLTNASGASLAPGQCLPPQPAPTTATVTSVFALSPTR